MNSVLLFFDFVLCLPVTLIRYLIIYLYGSKYNLHGFTFLDIMAHADKPYFNQSNENPTIDTLDEDITRVIKRNTQLSDTENNQICIIDENYKIKTNQTNEQNKNLFVKNNESVTKSEDDFKNSELPDVTESVNHVKLNHLIDNYLEDSMIDTDAINSDDVKNTKPKVDVMLEHVIDDALKELDTTLDDSTMDQTNESDVSDTEYNNVESSEYEYSNDD